MSGNTNIAVQCGAIGRKPALRFLIAWAVVGFFVLWIAMAIFKMALIGGNLLFPISILIGVPSLIALVLAFSYVPFVIATAVAEGGRLVLSEEGIGVPSKIPGIGQPAWFPWSDLKKLQLKKRGTYTAVLFRFKRSTYELDASKFLPGDLERILLGVEVWSKSTAWDQAAEEFRDSLQDQSRGISRLSYTSIWESELSRHFNSTLFVPLAPGARLRNNSLEIVRQIAFGGFSAIYLAREGASNVVIKESVPPVDAPAEIKAKASELFQREATLLSHLRHSHIAKVRDNFVENDRNYLVLDFISGTNLRQLVAWKGPLAEETVLNLARQMTEILVYLHSQDPPVVHRDFTPDNLVLRDDGELILIDFGAANLFIGTATGTLVGKQCYMAPEQIKGKASPASDVYSMGGTLHFLCTAKDPEALSTSHPAAISPKVSKRLDELIAALTALSSADRPVALDIFAKLLPDGLPQPSNSTKSAGQ